MRSLFLTPFFFLCNLSLHAQQVKEKLIVTDADSTLLKAESQVFSRNGNYCFETRQDESRFFVTNMEKKGPFRRISGRYGSSGSISYTSGYDVDEAWYYRNSYGTAIFGPVKGKLERATANRTCDSIAITVKYQDSVYYYLNGKWINTVHHAKAAFSGIYDWCVFSPNGRSMYYKICPGHLTQLYKDGVLIDSSNSFTEMRINDRGEYVYGKGIKPAEKGKYDYMFFVHTSDTVFGPLRTDWSSCLLQNGGYYCSGDDNGPQYLAIDGNLHRNVHETFDLLLLDGEHYFFFSREHRETTVVTGGNAFSVPYTNVYAPSMDAKGNYAFYGMKDYYLWKVVNGRQLDSVSRNGIRGTPLYISPSGSSLHYFRSEDSTYLFHDSKQLFPAFGNDTFKVQDGREFFFISHERYEKAIPGNSLLYAELGPAGYFIYNGEFSRPLLPVKEKSYRRAHATGELAAGDIGEHGFFFIQKTGDDMYLVCINNSFYHELRGIDRVLRESCFFDGKQLVFYAVKERSFYQYTITP